MNIVLFGDSHLGRFGKNPIVALESLIEHSVIYNCSAGGFTSFDGVKRSVLISALNPEVIIFCYGGNDVAPWKSITPKKIYEENMRKIFEAFPNSKKLLFNSPDVDLADPVQTEEFNSLLHEYKNTLCDVCSELSVTVINGNDVVEGLDEYHEEDGVHMNQAAYMKVIQRFAERVNSLLH